MIVLDMAIIGYGIECALVVALGLTVAVVAGIVWLVRRRKKKDE